jgi:hypothetical protein
MQFLFEKIFLKKRAVVVVGAINWVSVSFFPGNDTDSLAILPLQPENQGISENLQGGVFVWLAWPKVTSAR